MQLDTKMGSNRWWPKYLSSCRLHEGLDGGPVSQLEPGPSCRSIRAVNHQIHSIPFLCGILSLSPPLKSINLFFEIKLKYLEKYSSATNVFAEKSENFTEKSADVGFSGRYETEET